MNKRLVQFLYTQNIFMQFFTVLFGYGIQRKYGLDNKIVAGPPIVFSRYSALLGISPRIMLFCMVSQIHQKTQ